MRQAIALVLAGIGGLGLIPGKAFGEAAANKSAAKEARGGATPLQRTGSANETAQRGVELATSGRCKEAMPRLKRTMRAVADKELKYNVTISAARCAMSLDDPETVAEALLLLSREFPKDPQALYLETHYFSELAQRAAQELAASAPESAQAHQLQAEALESQAKWEEAAAEYRGILRGNPQMPGIHYRLGRVYLSLAESGAPAGSGASEQTPATPGSAENTAKAKSEFEEELKIDPRNAAAEFLLGEVARRAGQWEPAIRHFTAASNLDSGFAEAFLALGMSLNAAERFPEAVRPLEAYTKMMAEDPAGHYQLSIAYSRTGRREDAAREMAVQQELVRRNPNGARAPE